MVGADPSIQQHPSHPTRLGRLLGECCAVPIQSKFGHSPEDPGLKSCGTPTTAFPSDATEDVSVRPPGVWEGPQFSFFFFSDPGVPV